MNLGKREKFIKIYSNLPIGVRQEIILVIGDDKPITWDVAYSEIFLNTELSEEILNQLEKLGII